VRVLTWNLFHGRSQPPAHRELAASFAAALARWEWDAALLQEVPPWWPALLARACGAEHRAALTSRNFALRLRKAAAVRWPDVIKSNGGGCNAVLVRRPITEHRVVRLRWVPERRVAQLVRLGDGICLVNFHGSSRPELAREELAALWGNAVSFSAGAPMVLGGDLNLRAPLLPADEIAHVASRDVDHIFARGFVQFGPAQQLDRRVEVGERRVELSDHPPLAVVLGAPAGARRGRA
jgi:endonuclease/exonuclease/phosphatase family metal-dependent hydrolase